jgi:hypothetical protein
VQELPSIRFLDSGKEALRKLSDEP